MEQTDVSEIPSKTSSKFSFHGFETFILSFVGVFSILGYLKEHIIHTFGESYALVILVAIVLIFLVYFLFNKIPEVRKERTLNLRPTGEPMSDYFTTSPREDDKYKFFETGYEQYLKWLSNPKAPLLYLTGASGVGKSSLISAYLVPELVKEKRITVFSVRTYHDPLKQLQISISNSATNDKKATPEACIDLIRHYAAASSNSNETLIIFDQFEEFFLLRTNEKLNEENNEEVDSQNELDKLKRFFQLFLDKPPQNVTILISYRDDFQALIEQLDLTARTEHVNFEQVNALNYHQAEAFLRRSGLNIPSERMETLLKEAASIDSPATIRPIVLNILGIILNRMVDHPDAFKRTSNLIRQYILEGLGKEVEVERVLVLKAMLTDFNTAQPRSVEELAIASGLNKNALDNQLLAMNNYGLVRCLDKEETNPTKRKWQIAHDFIALQLEKVIYSLSRGWWKKLRPWLAPILVLTLIIFSGSFYGSRKENAIDHLNKNGLLWDGNTKTITSNSQKLTDSLLKVLSQDIVLLQPDSIKLFNVSKIENIEYVKNYPSLKCLCLSNCSHLKNIEALKNLTGLTSLNLMSSDSLTNAEVLKNLTQLTSLDLTGCSKLTSIEAIKNLRKLTSLTLIFCERLADLEPLKNLTNLVTLNLSYCERLTNVEALKNLTHLTTLDLSGCSKLKDIEPLKNLTGLTLLDLNMFSKLTNIEALKNLTHLTSLNLGISSKLTNIEVIKNLTELTSLKLTDFDSLTNIEPLKNLTHLTSLELNTFSALTNVESLENLTHLTELDLNGCSKLKNIEPLKNLTGLTSLTVTSCDSLKNIEVLKNLFQITYLDLRDCKKITRLDIENLIKFLPHNPNRKIESDYDFF